jgi:hypothetical protein
MVADIYPIVFRKLQELFFKRISGQLYRKRNK